MFRNLKAIEIAEGALLADVAVILQLIITYLPLPAGHSAFRILIFVVYTILVLRRGLYVGIMGMGVSCFLGIILMGPQTLYTLFFEACGGLFLGLTMRYRWHHFPLVLLGATGGALALYGALWGLSFLTGFSILLVVRSLHRTYDLVVAFIGGLAQHIGLGVWWLHSAYPLVAAVADWGFTYWWFTLYLALLAFTIPFVTMVYVATNFFVRLLGYDVRPIPEGRMRIWLRWIARRVLRAGIKRGWLKRRTAEVKGA